MATFAELQTRVQNRIIDLPSRVTSEVPNLVRAAVREIQNKHNFRIMEALLTANTNTAGSPTNLLVAKPSDWKAARGKPYERQQYSKALPMSWGANRRRMDQRYGIDPTLMLGHPREVFEGEPTTVAGASSFYVLPFPDGNSEWSDGEYRIVIPYWKYLTALSADGDTNWFTVNAEEYITFKATSEGFFLNWDEQRGTLWAQKAELKFKEVRDVDAGERLSGVEHLIPHVGTEE